MIHIDTERLSRLQSRMQAENLAALVCRLPENLVYLTDYWPHLGVSFAVMPQQGRPLLFIPQFEQDYANVDWNDVRPFRWGLLNDPDLYITCPALLTQVCQELSLKGEKVGVERGFETVAPTYRSAASALMHGLSFPENRVERTFE